MDRERLEEIFNEEIDNEPSLMPSAEQYDRTIDIVERLLSDSEEVRHYHDEEIRSLITATYKSIERGRTDDEVFAYQSGVKGYTYFENFLGSGELSNIMSALKREGVPLDALKVVTKGTQPDTFVSKEYCIEVTQIIEKVKGSSPVIAYFAIRHNGKTIYTFGDETYANVDILRKDDETDYDYNMRIFAGKQNKKRSSAYSGTVETSSGEKYKKWTTKTGKVFYTNWKGYRVKI